jgi:hypothetical protein
MSSGFVVLVSWMSAPQIELKNDLDPLLNFQAFYTTSAEKFEQIYALRNEWRQE